MEEAQEIAALLREELRPFTRKEIKVAIRERSLRPEAEVETLAQKVYEEGVRWTTEVLESFWDDLLYVSSLGEATGVGGEWKPGGPAGGEEVWIDKVDSLQAMFGIRKNLSRGGSVQVWCTFVKGGEDYDVESEDFDEEGGEGTVSVHIEDKGAKLLDVTLFLPEPPPFNMEFHLEAGVGFVDFTSRFRAVNGRVYFMGFIAEHVEESLKIARNLRSGFQAMGIDGLEEAIEALRDLKKGEARSHGAYTLARTEDFWFLYRGPLLGEPELDERLVLGEPVTLSFPGGVEMALKAIFWEQGVRLDSFTIRLGEETLRFGLRFGLPQFSAGIFSKNPVVGAIQAGLNQELWLMEEGWGRAPLSEASPQALALLRVLAQHEDPFGLLAEGKAPHYMTAELFAGL